MIKSLTVKQTKQAVLRFEEITGLQLVLLKNGKTVKLTEYYWKRFVNMMSQAHKTKRGRGISKKRIQQLLGQRHLIGGTAVIPPDIAIRSDKSLLGS